MGKTRRNTEKLKNFVVQLTEIEQAPENILQKKMFSETSQIYRKIPVP